MDRSRGELTGPSQFHKYEKFVVLMMENRSFDHYWSPLDAARARRRGPGQGMVGRRTLRQVDRRPQRATSRTPISTATASRSFARTTTRSGTSITNGTPCHEQFSEGTNEGFIRPHQRDLERLNDNNEQTKAFCWGHKGPDGKEKCGEPGDPMAYYTRQDTPIFHSLFDNYAIL